MSKTDDFPVFIEFVSGSRLHFEPEVMPKLPILRNGPPGTFVIFTSGARVPLPTDQIVFAETSARGACVGFGGMSFEGMDDGQLVFNRVRDLQPEERLSPQRGRRMTLEPEMVSSIHGGGRQLWPIDS